MARARPSHTRICPLLAQRFYACVVHAQGLRVQAEQMQGIAGCGPGRHATVGKCVAPPSIALSFPFLPLPTRE